MYYYYMPIESGQDNKGSFFRWGKRGKKYYFNPRSEKSFSSAHEKALKQGIAIMYSEYRRREIPKLNLRYVT